jgi:hypothetical protein
MHSPCRLPTWAIPGHDCRSASVHRPAPSNAKRITSNGASGRVLPDGTTVGRDGSGGFRLPNGTKCPSDGARGYLCQY